MLHASEKCSDGSSNEPATAFLQHNCSKWPCTQPLKAAPPTPLASLLQRLRQLKRVYLEPEEANADLHHLVNSVLFVYPRLAIELERFGWHQGFWQHALDVQGLASCLKKFKYEKQPQQLGSGSYGVVFKARDIETQELLAIKKLAAKYEDDCGLPDSTIREITTLRELRHPNIVQLRDIISTLGSSHVYLVLDYLDCDLRHYLNTCPSASSMPVVKSAMYQILAGVAYLHANSILHRDLKPQNILVEHSTGRIKITDFGLARSFLPPHKPCVEKVVTLYYRAPELLLGCAVYSKAIDLWSVGCILAEMLTFKPLFQDNSEVGIIMKLFQTLGTPTEAQWPGCTALIREDLGGADPPSWPTRSLAETIPVLVNDPNCLDLLSRMLTYDPAQRITAAAALRHPWFWDVSAP